MKKIFFLDKLLDMGLSSEIYLDIYQNYNECFEEEVAVQVQEKVDRTVAKITMQLENKLRNEIRQEELITGIAKISAELQTLRLLLEKACSPTPRQDTVNVKNSVNLPTYDRLWNKIRKIQKEKGITDSELAKLFGLSKRTLSRYDKSACPLKMENLSNFIDSIGGFLKIVC